MMTSCVFVHESINLYPNLSYDALKRRVRGRYRFGAEGEGGGQPVPQIMVLTISQAQEQKGTVFSRRTEGFWLMFLVKEHAPSSPSTSPWVNSTIRGWGALFVVPESQSPGPNPPNLGIQLYVRRNGMAGTNSVMMMPWPRRGTRLYKDRIK